MKRKMTILTLLLTLSLVLSGFNTRPVLAQDANEACGDFYTVQSGDYLVLIADMCGVSYSDLIAANPQIEDPNLIFPGQVINIPVNGDTPSIPVTGGSFYIVQPGDTLSTIADRFNVTIDELLDVNPNLSSTNLIQAGTQVQLPEGAARIPTASITPTTARPGDFITLAATGFRANTAVRIGFGRVASEFDFIGQTLVTNANGALYRTVQVPAWAETGDRYVFIVLRTDNTSLRAISNPLTISDDDLPVIPVTGPDAYIIQDGDTLSEIAVRYGTTVDRLLALNPSIENPALIFPGQRIDLPAGVQPISPWVRVSDQSPEPGETIQVRAINFPANAMVDILLAPEGEDWQVVVDGQTDSDGEVLANINVPSDAVDGEAWVAIVTTTERPDITRAASQRMIIED